jgi:hypothetical protein
MTSEHLLNLQRIGQLDAVPFSAELLEKMLNVAQSLRPVASPAETCTANIGG